MQKTKLNNKVIEVVKLPDTVPVHKILGNDLFSVLYNNIFICARKHSGKTNLIFNIIKQTVNTDTTVIVFSGTHNQDSTWGYIKGFLEAKKVDNMFFDSILDGKVNSLDEIIEMIKHDDDDKHELTKEEKEAIRVRKMVNTILRVPEERVKKKKKNKLIAPKYLFIFDDISSELKNKSVDKLLKTNRHFKCRVIVSTQWITDLLPSSRRQIQSYILFPGHNTEKLETIYENADVHITFEKFLELYHDATSERYNFFFFSSDYDDYRKNFNERYEI